MLVLCILLIGHDPTACKVVSFLELEEGVITGQITGMNLVRIVNHVTSFLWFIFILRVNFINGDEILKAHTVARS